MLAEDDCKRFNNFELATSQIETVKKRRLAKRDSKRKKRNDARAHEQKLLSGELAFCILIDV